MIFHDFRQQTELMKKTSATSISTSFWDGVMRPRKRERRGGERDEQTTGKKSKLAASGGKLSGTTDGGGRGGIVGIGGGDVRGNSAQCVAELSSIRSVAMGA